MKQLSLTGALVVLLIFTVTFLVGLLDSIDSTGIRSSRILISLVVATGAATVATIVVIFWAIPVHLVLNKKGYSHISWYILAAIIPSFMFIYILKPFGSDPFIALFTQALIVTCIGSIAASAFWYRLVYRQRSTVLKKTK